MPVVQPEELVNFANSLPDEDFAGVNDALPTLMTGSMPEELFNVNEFIAAWAPRMAGFGKDFHRGMEVFRDIARVAADRFETADADHAAIMSQLVNGARTNQNSTSTGDLSTLPWTRPDTGPLGPLFPPTKPPAGGGYNPYAGGGGVRVK